MSINDLTYSIIGCAYKVSSELGPGLLESTYETCLIHELLEAGLQVESQIHLPVAYKGLNLKCGYRIDLLVNNSVIVEIKSVKELLPVHTAQIMTYMKLSGIKAGLLFNFNVSNMQDGIKRLKM